MYSRVYVEITNICNMRCSFCHGHSRKPERMTLPQFRHILDQLQGHTQYIYYHLMGEPLTHPLLPEFLKLAGEQGFRSNITTNGTLLEKHGQAILDAGLHKVNISLHSFEDGNTQAFTKYLSIVCNFVDKAADYGTIVSFRLWNRGCDDGRNDEILSYLREHLPGEWTPNSRGYRIRNRVFIEWGERFIWPDKDAPIQGDDVFCYGLRDHFGILCDGSVVPCCLDSDGIITLGNVHQEPLTDILSSERAKTIWQKFGQRSAAEELCRRCSYAQRFK